jgi:predicted  nucleic acid-binding Zn-ribbon protein
LEAAPNPAKDAPLAEAGNKLLAKYSEQLKALQAELGSGLPKADASETAALQKARDAVKSAEAAAKTTAEALGKIGTGKALVEHAKGKWIGGAEKGIAAAEAALKKATTDAEREAAKKDIAKWQANKEDGLKALKERQEAYDKAKVEEPKLKEANTAAQAALTQARATEAAAAKAILSKLDPFIAGDKLDAKLVKAAVLADATPRGLAEFAQQGAAQSAMIDALLADTALMKQMLEAGGAKFGKYGRAVEIYAAIRKTSPKSADGTLQRLALAVALEHAKPIEQSNPASEKNGPATVDPVKRYQHYEKAFLDGELDPAFKDMNTWELRMVVDCDAPDSILSWGREMLRNYRPDHIYNPDYGWRYTGSVRTEVKYGSQEVSEDLPTLQTYQNIINNGGVCGRRAFFGRFISQSFGIPTWGVTQHKHAALSHWTPKGWVVNLGAGFEHSWWDKDEAPKSGSDFLLETQAREHGAAYMKVLRAQWISRILGEQQYNGRKSVAGGFWSGMAQYQTVGLASTAVALGPLGQELGEANEAKQKQVIAQPKLEAADQKATIAADGTITIPAVGFSKPSGHFAAVKSFLGGMQIHCTGGFKADYEIEVPKAGKYALTARVVTVQDGQKFRFEGGESKAPLEVAVPYTIGKWQQTPPVELALANGKNVIRVALQEGSRGVTVKDFVLSPAK